MSNYRIEIKRYDLDTAVIDKIVQEFGNHLQVVASSSDAATISVKPLGEKLTTEGRLALQVRDYVRVPDPFNRVAMTWDAQPGEWVDLMFLTQDPAPEEFEYNRQQRGTIDNISSTVSVTDMAETLVTDSINITTSPILGFAENIHAKHRGVYNNSSSAMVYYSEDPAMAKSFPVPPSTFKTIPFRGDVYLKGSASTTASVEEYS